MSRNRNPRASTSDLLTWPENAPESSPVVSSTARRSHQPSDKMSEVLGGRKVTNDEDSHLIKKPTSGTKLKEMNGSGIFSASAEDTAQANSKDRTSIRICQQTKTGNSQVSLGTDENISSKPTSIAEAAKQRELSGTLHDPDPKNKKQASNAKTKELSGTDIFGPAPEILPRPSAAARIQELKECTVKAEPIRRGNVRTAVKVSEPEDESVKKTAKKIHDQKFADLTGNNIFKGDAPAAGSAEKPLSSAKLREMSGSDIFAIGKAEETKEYTRGTRKPPGGDSTIALI